MDHILLIWQTFSKEIVIAGIQAGIFGLGIGAVALFSSSRNRLSLRKIIAITAFFGFIMLGFAIPGKLHSIGAITDFSYALIVLVLLAIVSLWTVIVVRYRPQHQKASVDQSDQPSL